MWCIFWLGVKIWGWWNFIDVCIVCFTVCLWTVAISTTSQTQADIKHGKRSTKIISVDLYEIQPFPYQVNLLWNMLYIHIWFEAMHVNHIDTWVFQTPPSICCGCKMNDYLPDCWACLYHKTWVSWFLLSGAIHISITSCMNISHLKSWIPKLHQRC